MKPIDAEPIIKSLSAMKTQLGYDAIDIDGMIKALRETKEIDSVPPHNDLLTLAELREMDGEPVWITDIVDGISTKEYWALIFSVEEDSICFSTKECGDDCRVFGLYENTWFAYRHKPEEG